MAEEKRDSNIIYIGKKEAMSYVLAIATQFKSGAKEVVVKARGNSISRAVWISEVTRLKFIRESAVKEVKIGTDEVQDSNGRMSKVPFINITLAVK